MYCTVYEQGSKVRVLAILREGILRDMFKFKGIFGNFKVCSNGRCKKTTEHEKFLYGNYPRTRPLFGGERRMDGKTDDLATLNGDSERSRSMCCWVRLRLSQESFDVEFSRFSEANHYHMVMELGDMEF